MYRRETCADVVGIDLNIKYKYELDTRMTAKEQLQGKRINRTPLQSHYSNNWSVCKLIVKDNHLSRKGWVGW